MNADTLLLIFVGVSAFAFALQAISVWQASRSVSELTQKLQRQSENLERDVHELTGRLQEIVDGLKPVIEVSDQVKNNVNAISNLLKERAEDVDQFVGEILQVGREQSSKVDYVVTDTVKKFEQTTQVIQKDVLGPVTEIAALVKGVRSGLEYLFARKRQARQQEYPEEEMFI